MISFMFQKEHVSLVSIVVKCKELDWNFFLINAVSAKKDKSTRKCEISQFRGRITCLD